MVLSSTVFTPLRNFSSAQFTSQDVLVLVGELFGRGYANGLLDEAKRCGMKVIGTTVGRRDRDKSLRKLTEEELSTLEDSLGGKVINVPLEAGFDLDIPEDGQTVCDMLQGLKKDNWDKLKLDWNKVENCKKLGRDRFLNSLKEVVRELEGLVLDGGNVYFAHVMAGGIPRAKIMMPVANRVFKGYGERYLSSKHYWDSDLGKLCAQSFEEVTANTFQHLLDVTAGIRDQVESAGSSVFYSAYGYHGTEVLQGNQYQWQSYIPYKQGEAKVLLEQHAIKARNQGIAATVFNCPEIRTNSSDVFSGVELSLFFLFDALRKEASDSSWIEELIRKEKSRLLSDEMWNEIEQKLKVFSEHPEIKELMKYELWPADNSPVTSELFIRTSEEILKLHKDPKDLISDSLSQLVVESTGKLILSSMFETMEPVLWLGHDIIAKELNSRLS